MEKDPEKRKKRRMLWLVIPLLIAALLLAASAVYLGDYYRADAEAGSWPDGLRVEERRLDNGDLVFGTGDEAAGFIFYPGGKVEHAAYAPLMRELAAEGVFCVICEMPFRLAVLEPDAADGLQEQYPEVGRWYLGGQSLGGAMAASYLADHAEDYDGLVLLGAYSTADLSRSGVKVLSVFGSEDKVLNREAYERNRSRLPAALRELVIEGGCHAGFGMYGPQSGDGTPTISTAEQIRQTTAAILEWMDEPAERAAARAEAP